MIHPTSASHQPSSDRCLQHFYSSFSTNSAPIVHTCSDLPSNPVSHTIFANDQPRAAGGILNTHSTFAMDNSPLKRLPLELRLDIYDKVIYAEVFKVTLNKPIENEKRISLGTFTSLPHPLAIRFTCKEIATETAGIVYKINNSWSFVQPDDDSTTWGKRLRQWCSNAGEHCLQRARNLQFDIGEWGSRPKHYPRGDLAKVLHAQIGSMYQNLPKQLRQCEQTFKLRIDWSSGVKMADGSRDRLSKVTLILPLWTDGVNIQGGVFDAACQAKERLYKYDYTWHMGARNGEVPTLVDPPRYENQLARRIDSERSMLLRLLSEIGLSTSIAFKESTRERLEEHAVDA